MTDRLYFDDPYRIEFEAKIVDKVEFEGKPALILNRTCFYPTAGGQECDRGFISDVPVVDVIDQDNEIIHVLERDVPGTEIRGRIDWKRRFDFMQQHSGQHVLSQSFFRVLDANTTSSHLGQESSTIEILRETLTLEEAHSVEDFANSVVFENRAIKTYFRSEDELTSVPLRRTPKKKGHIRIVEIDGLDYTPCGGTHCRHTGEIGLIKVGRWEKIRGHVRIQFLCGKRALSEYRWKSEAIEELADHYSAKGTDVLALVTKQSEENKVLHRNLKDLTEQAIAFEAKKLFSEAESMGDLKLVKSVFDERPAEELRTLATKIVSYGKVVVLLGNRGEKAQLVFSCSEGLPYKMNDLIGIACTKIDGRGGGTPRLAFGGGPLSDKVEEAVESVFENISKGQK